MKILHTFFSLMLSDAGVFDLHRTSPPSSSSSSSKIRNWINWIWFENMIWRKYIGNKCQLQFLNHVCLYLQLTYIIFFHTYLFSSSSMLVRKQCFPRDHLSLVIFRVPFCVSLFSIWKQKPKICKIHPKIN